MATIYDDNQFTECLNYQFKLNYCYFLMILVLPAKNIGGSKCKIDKNRIQVCILTG